MSDATRLLSAITAGDKLAAEALLPLIYGELRSLATRKMASEKKGHTLQPTALVHEAYLRLVNTEDKQAWDGKGHFFAAAAEAMRRILVENVRRKRSQKHGGAYQRDFAEVDDLVSPEPSRELDMLALDEALAKLEAEDEQLSTIVKLRCFVGMTVAETADATGIPRRSVDRLWAYARAWLHRELSR
jgi:RNA polymerase sigma factor (TIGR02999 family)